MIWYLLIINREWCCRADVRTRKPRSCCKYWIIQNYYSTQEYNTACNIILRGTVPVTDGTVPRELFLLTKNIFLFVFSRDCVRSAQKTKYRGRYRISGTCSGRLFGGRGVDWPTICLLSSKARDFRSILLFSSH